MAVIHNKQIENDKTEVSTVEKKRIIRGTKRVSKITKDSKNVGGVILPCGSPKAVKDMSDVINNLTEEEINDNLSEEDQTALGIAFQSSDNIPKGNVYEQVDDSYVQEIKYGDKTIKLKDISLSNKVKGSLTGEKAKLKLASTLGLGGFKQIPLLHSGFWISLDVIFEADIIALETSLLENEVELGRKTNGLIYGNDSVIYNRIIMDFVIEHLHQTSLKLPDDENIKDYIKVPDLNIIMLGLLNSFYPDGMNFIKTCRNTLSVDETGKDIKCNYSITGLVDLDKMLFINRDAFTEKHINLLLKRSTGSVTIDDVKEYQRTLKILEPYTFTIDISEDNPLQITLEMPNINEYLLSGEKWVENNITMLDKLVRDTTDENTKDILLDKLDAANLLSSFSHFITKLKMADGSTIEKDDIDNTINLLASNTRLKKTIIKHIRDFISNRVVAIVGSPVYICPNCKKAVEGDNTPKEFSEIIPINNMTVFSKALTHRTSKITTLGENI